MTVLETIKKYDLEDYSMRYVNQRRDIVDLTSLEKIANLEIDNIFITFNTKSLIIDTVEPCE